LVELRHDVTAADELAVHVELRNRGPRRELFDAFAHLGIGEHVHVGEGLAHFLQSLHHARGEAALREVFRPFHEENDFVLTNRIFDLLSDVVAHWGALQHRDS
jgi:hypothetical protein